MYVAQMLHALANRNDKPTPVPAKVVRDTKKAREAHREVIRKWFRANMKDEVWSTSKIASNRGQDNSSCLPLLYELEAEGFLTRAGIGTRTGRGKCPLLWKLTNP